MIWGILTTIPVAVPIQLNISVICIGYPLLFRAYSTCQERYVKNNSIGVSFDYCLIELFEKGDARGTPL